MTVVNMSIHRALGELKLYQNKIDTLLRSQFVVANKHSNKTISGKTVGEIQTVIQGNFDSIVALMENKKRIKDAIVKSNAVTIVTIGGKQMTVAEAIERKVSIELSKTFLETLQRQFNQQNSKVEQENAQLPTKLETYLVAVLGGDKASRKPEDVATYSERFNNENTFELINPEKVQDYIVKLTNEIDEFFTEVDYVLSNSNALTTVDVNLSD